MWPCAFSTRFQAPVLGNRSLTVLVTIPLSQRKRSAPRTSTRRIQPRSCRRGSEGQRRCFHFRRVQLSWGQRPAVNGKFVRCMSGFKHRGQRSGLQVLGKIGFRHGNFSAVPAPDFLRRLGAKPHPDYSLEVRSWNRRRLNPELARQSRGENRMKNWSDTKTALTRALGDSSPSVISLAAAATAAQSQQPAPAPQQPSPAPPSASASPLRRHPANQATQVVRQNRHQDHPRAGQAAFRAGRRAHQVLLR